MLTRTPPHYRAPMAIRIAVSSHAEAAAIWRALTHVPPELLQPCEIWLDGHGYLWSLSISSDGVSLQAQREAPQARSPQPEACE